VAQRLGESLHVCMRALRATLAKILNVHAPPPVLERVERFEAARRPPRGGMPATS
jgi:hypothetical protein